MKSNPGHICMFCLLKWFPYEHTTRQIVEAAYDQYLYTYTLLIVKHTWLIKTKYFINKLANQCMGKR